MNDSLTTRIQKLSDGSLPQESLPKGRLLGLPELPEDDYWVDTAGATILLNASEKTLSSWISRNSPKGNPIPKPQKFLYRRYWRASELIQWQINRSNNYNASNISK